MYMCIQPIHLQFLHVKMNAEIKENKEKTVLN